MRTVVTGATGFVGRAVVHHLLAQGHEVVALSRTPGRAALPRACVVQAWSPAGATDPAPFAGAGAVVHLAGESIAAGRWTDARKQAITTSRVAGTRALVAAIGQLPPAERPRTLVAASAVGWYGDRGDERLDEASAGGGGFLADVCRAWETESFGAESLGVRTAVLRLGVVLGRGGGALARMLPPFRLGLGGRLGSGQQWMSWIHLTDLARLVAFAIATDAAAGVIAAVAPEPVRNAEFTAALARVLQRPALVPVPALALRLVLGEMAGVLLDGQRVEPTRALALGFRFTYPGLPEALAEACGATATAAGAPAAAGSAG